MRHGNHQKITTSTTNSNYMQERHRKQKLLVYMHKPPKLFVTYPNPKNVPNGSEKAQKDTKKKQKVKKSENQQSYKMKVVSKHKQTPKNFSDPIPTPEIASKGSK